MEKQQSKTLINRWYDCAYKVFKNLQTITINKLIQQGHMRLIYTNQLYFYTLATPKKEIKLRKISFILH